MADYGVTPEGWEAKRLADILDEAGVELAEIVDPKTGNRLNPDFNSDDPAMQIVQDAGFRPAACAGSITSSRRWLMPTASLWRQRPVVQRLLCQLFRRGR